MMARNRVRREAALEIDRLLRSFRAAPADATSVRMRTRRYADECGCKAGGAALILAGCGSLAALVTCQAWTVSAALWCFLFTVIAAAAGKTTGVLVATLRIFSLRRKVRNKLVAEGGGHVGLH